MTTCLPGYRSMKSNNELAKYKVSRGIEQEPSFVWWVGLILKHGNKIISKIKRIRSIKRDLENGIIVPKVARRQWS